MRSRLFQHAATYTVSNFSVALVPFLLLPALTRHLSPLDYGFVALFAVVLSTFTVLISLNLHGAITVRFFDSRGFDAKTYVSTCCRLVLLAAFAFALLSVLLGSPLESALSLPKKWIWLATLAAAMQVMVLILLAILQSNKRPAPYGGLRFSQALVEAGLSLFLVLVLAWSWQGRLLAIAVSSALVGGASIYILARNQWLVRSFDRAAARDALWYGLPLMPHALGGLVLGMADRLLVAHHLDLTSTGLYFVAVQTGLVVGIAADAFNRAYSPWLMEVLVKHDLQRDLRIVKLTYAYFAGITTVAILLGWLLPWLFGVMVGPEYQDAAPIARYMLLGNAFTGMYYMVTNYIFFTGHTGRLSLLTMSVGLGNLALMSYLLRAQGLQGAAIAFMLGQAALFIGAWLLSASSRKMPWAPWRWKSIQASSTPLPPRIEPK
jgi:O-antigen/teichoic acid export membrane protein